MVWVGLDDTDSLSGGCTTNVMHRMIKYLRTCDDSDLWEVSEYPSLVRLWPFAQRRTRGNAAVSVEIRCLDENSEDILIGNLDRLWKELVIPEVKKYGTATSSMHNEREQSNASPSMIFSRIKPDESWYWNCVRNEVTATQCLDQIPEGCRVWEFNGGHGKIGALAAISWHGDHDNTWEVTAYRKSENIAKTRVIPINISQQIDQEFPETIMNRDPTNDKSLLSPNTPCPVLFGVRSETAEGAIFAAESIIKSEGCEDVSGWQIWRTNQATDDHIVSALSATLSSNPITIKQGHTILRTNEFGDLVSFSQGGDVNRLAQNLRQGDQIEFSGLEAPDGSMHIEKLRIISISNKRKLRPLCSCGKRMKSMGSGQGIRCPNCGERDGDIWSQEVNSEVPFALGEWVEPSPSNRRHLSSPLSRRSPA